MSKTPKILLIYTGGTIGMINDPETGQLKSFDFAHVHTHVPEIHRLNVSLTSISFEEPIDSSEMGFEMVEGVGMVSFYQSKA
jgi:L-asparaginase